MDVAPVLHFNQKYDDDDDGDDDDDNIKMMEGRS